MANRTTVNKPIRKPVSKKILKKSIKSITKSNIKNYDSISNQKKQEKAIELIQENIGLVKFNSKTDSYWKDLEIANVKVMILSIPYGTFIRGANDLKQELSEKDVNGNFLILNGLAYKSDNDYESIVYMKV